MAGESGVFAPRAFAKGFAVYMSPYLAVGAFWTIFILIACLCAIAVWAVAQAISIT
jgi:hypothetical protein